MRVTLNRHWAQLFERHPVPWRLERPPRGEYAVLLDNTGRVIVVGDRAYVRHYFVALYLYVVPWPGITQNMPPVDYAIPTALQWHPLPWTAELQTRYAVDPTNSDAPPAADPVDPRVYVNVCDPFCRHVGSWDLQNKLEARAYGVLMDLSQLAFSRYSKDIELLEA